MYSWSRMTVSSTVPRWCDEINDDCLDNGSSEISGIVLKGGIKKVE